MRVTLLLGAGLALALVLVLAAFRNALVERVIFQPTRGAVATPARLGVAGEEVFLEAADGVRVHAYWLPSPGATRAILFLHGNAGNASHRIPNAAELAALGADVLLLDYRGYGRSEGSPSEAGVYLDARAALAHLTGERGHPEDRVVLFGRSLGGAVAVDLAQGRRLAGVVLESTFTSVADLAERLGGWPLAALAGSRFDSAAKISRVESPILFLHGDRDGVVPYALGRRLYEGAPRAAGFETIAGAGHNDTVSVGGRAYFERLGAFLDEVAPRPAAQRVDDAG